MRSRGLTVVYAAICAGIVSLVMAWFISQELNKGVKDTQDQMHVEQVDACVRGNVNRNDKYDTATKEEANAVYMAGQANDPEVEKGWINIAKDARDRQTNIEEEATRIGFRLPGSVMVDCLQVISK